MLHFRALRRPSALLLVAPLVACAAPRAARGPLSGPVERVSLAEASYAQVADEGPRHFARRGFFVAGAGVATELADDDFDGRSSFVHVPSGTQLILPELDRGTGWGLAIGYRGYSNSIQYTYAATTHDDDFMGTSLEDEIKTYSLDFKHHWNVDGALQPYLLIGVTVPRIRIDQGASNGAQVGVATYQGLGANLGAGAALYLTPRLALFGEAFYRWAEIEDARGLGVRADLDHRIDGSGLTARAGLSFTF